MLGALESVLRPQRRLSKKGAEHRPAGAEGEDDVRLGSLLRRGQGPPTEGAGQQGVPAHGGVADGTAAPRPCRALGFASHTSGPCAASSDIFNFSYLFLALVDLLFSAAEGGSLLLSRSSGSRALRLPWLQCVVVIAVPDLGHRPNSCAAPLTCSKLRGLLPD